MFSLYNEIGQHSMKLVHWLCTILQTVTGHRTSVRIADTRQVVAVIAAHDFNKRGFINVQIWPIELACYTTLRMSRNIKYPLISFAYSRPARPACQKTNHYGSRNKKINMRAIYFADSKLTDFKNMFCLCQCGHEHFSDLQHALGHLCNKTIVNIIMMIMFSKQATDVCSWHILLSHIWV